MKKRTLLSLIGIVVSLGIMYSAVYNPKKNLEKIGENILDMLKKQK